MEEKSDYKVWQVKDFDGSKHYVVADWPESISSSERKCVERLGVMRYSTAYRQAEDLGYDVVEDVFDHKRCRVRTKHWSREEDT